MKNNSENWFRDNCSEITLWFLDWIGILGQSQVFSAPRRSQGRTHCWSDEKFQGLQPSRERNVKSAILYSIGWTKTSLAQCNLLHSLSSEFSYEIKESFAMSGAQDHELESYPDDHLPEFRASMKEMRKDCYGLIAKLLSLFDKAINPKDKEFYTRTHQAFTGSSNPNIAILRTHYYPPVGPDVPVNSTRCAPHSDYGTFTLLFQDSMAGLEVCEFGQIIFFNLVSSNWSLLHAGQKLKGRVDFRGASSELGHCANWGPHLSTKRREVQCHCESNHNGNLFLRWSQRKWVRVPEWMFLEF